MTCVAGIACLAVALSLACRRKIVPHRYVRAALICLLIGGELQRYLTADIRFPETLPLNLCNITTWVAVLACLRLFPMAVEFTYFAGLAGGGMALVTPDMGSSMPASFFVNHGAIILTASALIYGRIAPLGDHAIWRAYAWFVLYVALIGLFDWKFGVNYGYLRDKPGTLSVLSVLGPWPFYIVWGFGVGFALFWLLWLPVRPRSVLRPKKMTLRLVSHAEHN
jgi:hypothetical integral membrane protein (TIGR02206 family)